MENHANNAKGATLCGTLICVCCNLHPDDLIRTVVLAGLGALVSFLVSMGMKKILEWLE